MSDTANRQSVRAYHARVRARQQERAAHDGGARASRSARARARSARRWADDEARADQQRRAGRLHLIVGDGVAGDPGDRAS